MLPLVVALLLAPPQDLEPAPPSPYDRVIELEITADDEPLIDGRGPTVVAEYKVEFDGTLHFWTRSELDLFLQVDDATEMRTRAADDSSGGGTTPYLALDVQKGNWLVVLVAAAPEASGSLTLHLIAAPETEAGSTAEGVARDVLREAARLVAEGQQAAARRLVAQALPEVIGTSGVDHPDLIEARAKLAVSMSAMGDSASARALEEAVLAGRERTLPEDHPDLLAVRANLAISMFEMGNLAGARALQESVLSSYERTLSEDHPDLLAARLNVAISMNQMGDLASARALEESVLADFERTLPEDHPYLRAARANLAASMFQMGDFAGARALQESVLAGQERTLPEDHPDLLAARGNLATLMHATGDLAGARALRESVLAGRERTLPEDHPYLLAARAFLALSLHEMGDLADARSLFESVLAGSERTLPEDHLNLLAARSALAGSMHRMGDVADARALWESVLTAYERTLPEGHPDLLTARANLAISMADMGDLTGAHAMLAKIMAGMRTRILISLALSPREARQTVASEGTRHSMVLLLSASAGSELEQAAFELTETMRIVASEAARSLLRFETDPELAPILEEAVKIRRALNDLIAGAAREGAKPEFSDQLTALSLRRDQLEGEASHQLAERGVVTDPVTAGALTTALAAGEVSVSYRRVDDQVLAHVLTSDGTLSRVDLGLASELAELASAWRAGLGAPLLRGDGPSRGVGLVDASGSQRDEDHSELSSGRSLRVRVLDPVLEAAGTNATRLFLCSDDLLFLLPFDALPLDADASPSARVGDRLSIVSEVSFARLLVEPTPIESSSSLLALGGVAYSAKGAVVEGTITASAPIREPDEVHPGTERSTALGLFSDIPESGHEAAAIANLFKQTFDTEPASLTSGEATKAALFEAAAGKRYVHIATHGWFAPENVKSIMDTNGNEQPFARMSLEERITGLAPMTLCGLALTGANNGRDSLGRVPGILTAEELCTLDLSQCELAVLSACETNVGIRRAGQGIQSLQAALYAAGARTSITSLWKVDDAATRRLFETFYTKLWKEKLGKADALWQAKMALRNEGHPVRDWAGWVLTGDPD
jgi:tetratricopeptide (TPR) repeat protein